jgi:nickel/cobalt exporter
MSLTERWRARGLAAIALLTVAALALAEPALATKSPFGVATPDSSGGAFGGPLGPLFQWVALRQAEFYRTLTATLSQMKEDGWAVWLLMAVSFAYGVFHAAGPGHGKAVISAYVLSSGESVRRGVLISFASAFVQALSAIAIVLVGSIALRVTAQSMTVATEWIEIASYALIAVVGAWLLFAKITGRGHHHHQHDDHDARAGHDHHDHAHTTRMSTNMSRRQKVWLPPGRRSLPWASGPAPGRSSSSSSPWRRACSSPASPRPSSWRSARG